MMKRCDWVSTDELYINYHDNEWGKPVYDDAMKYMIIDQWFKNKSTKE